MNASTGIELRCEYELGVELRTQPRGGDVVAFLPATDDIGDLVDEACTAGMLAGALPAEVDGLAVDVDPVFDPEPWVVAVVVTVSAGDGSRWRQRFASGRWQRRATARMQTASGDELPLHTSLCAQRNADLALRPPAWPDLGLVDATLTDFGVRGLGAGSLLTDRPVLVAARAATEIVEATRAAGAHEIGGCMLGALLRLPEPLRGTGTRLVTVLTACVSDVRHVGGLARLQFDPQAMAEAAQLADLRCRGERVLTAFHSHGWGRDCGRCNESAQCALPSVDHVSLDDYQVLEAMFPSKASLLPIAGRRLGGPPKQPVLAVHAWRGGSVQPIAWQAFAD